MSVHINRKAILRVIADAEQDKAPITGRNLRDCAVEICRYLGAQPCATSKIEELITNLVGNDELTFRDATLKPLSFKEREAIVKEKADEESRRRSARARSIEMREVPRLKRTLGV